MTGIRERIEKLRKYMEKDSLDAYIVLTDDFHASEYVGKYFKCREYISGFTGSAGKCVILKNEAGLWTDGRYFLQAEKQLKNTGITLYRIGEENVPTIDEYLKSKLSKKSKIGIDGRTLTVCSYRKINESLKDLEITIELNKDLIGEIWKDRPKLLSNKAWELDIKFSGKSRKEKLEDLRKIMEEKKIDATLISSLDDIGWLLNIRGNDVASTPVVLCYAIINRTNVHLYIQKEAFSSQLQEKLERDDIIVNEYMEIYDNPMGVKEGETLYIDPERLNISLLKTVKRKIKNITIQEGRNLTEFPKAVKNQTEVLNFYEAHKKDAVACIKFIYWLKKNVGKEKITEKTAADKLELFRKEQEGYIEPSFDTIAGYGPHGAIVHYSATKESDAELHASNFILVDSGGHYLEGTTDITRTIALGELSEEQKHYYTLVLKGNLNLAAAVFKYGCSGCNLDYLARKDIWAEGLDYNHGTGHGVGYLLSVHEGPNSFRYKSIQKQGESVPLEEGMVTSDEPGLYFEGKYGIRIENLLVCKILYKTEYGQFMGFEPLTIVPMERKAIVPQEMTDEELNLLNNYHNRVYETIKNRLPEDERKWLYEQTRPLYK